MGGNTRVMVLKTVFIVLGLVMVATLLFTISIDGLPFRAELRTPWMTATLVDFYINVIALAAWVSYKESSWLSSILWIILLVCLGSMVTCIYITFQLFKLSAEESSNDPVYHVLLRHQNKNNMTKTSSFQLVTARICFCALGVLMFGTLIYTILTYGSPFHKELLTPWMTATLIDFYINVAALSVWICYKESSWVAAFAWIALLVCFGSITTCVYLVRQFFQLSPGHPLYLVLLNRRHRAESRYERTSGHVQDTAAHDLS